MAVRTHAALRCFVVFKQKTAYEGRISDWSSDVCSSDLQAARHASDHLLRPFGFGMNTTRLRFGLADPGQTVIAVAERIEVHPALDDWADQQHPHRRADRDPAEHRSEEHTYNSSH